MFIMRDFPVLVLLLCGSAVRGYRSTGETRTDSAAKMGFTTSKYIGGIPVYNYDNNDPPEPDEGSVMMASDERNWIVMMRQEAKDSDIDILCKDDPDHERCSAHGDPDHGGVGFLEVRGSEAALESVVLEKADKVDFIEPDCKVIALDQGNVSLASYDDTLLLPWGLTKIGAQSEGNLGSGVHVYVMDTGVKHTHPDFEGRAIPTYDVTSYPRECGRGGRGDYRCADDGNGHGTHCAGTIAGRQYGVAKRATIRSVKVLRDNGEGSISGILEGVDWITSHATFPAVISMSLGSSSVSAAQRIAVRRAVNQGIPVVVAAGNANKDACGFSPAAFQEAITVGSFDSRNEKSSFSCYGRCVDIWAPGSDIVSASHMGGSTEKSGTSMACPHVAGAAALILGDEPSAQVPEVKRRLLTYGVKNSIYGLMAGDTNVALSVSFAFAGRVPARPPSTTTKMPTTTTTKTTTMQLPATTRWTPPRYHRPATPPAKPPPEPEDIPWGYRCSDCSDPETDCAPGQLLSKVCNNCGLCPERSDRGPPSTGLPSDCSDCTPDDCWRGTALFEKCTECGRCGGRDDDGRREPEPIRRRPSPNSPSRQDRPEKCDICFHISCSEEQKKKERSYFKLCSSDECRVCREPARPEPERREPAMPEPERREPARPEPERREPARPEPEPTSFDCGLCSPRQCREGSQYFKKCSGPRCDAC